MSQMSFLSGLPLISIALAVMLSGLIRLIQSSQLRQRVQMGMTSVRELAELSGIMDAKELQDVFGPPGMNRIWSHVTVAAIEERRELAGYLMSASRLHTFSMLAALAVLIFPHWSLQLVLMAAALIQTGAWLSASQLPK